jgi:hypothetical protein
MTSAGGSRAAERLPVFHVKHWRAAALRHGSVWGRGTAISAAVAASSSMTRMRATPAYMAGMLARAKAPRRSAAQDWNAASAGSNPSLAQASSPRRQASARDVVK